MHGKPVLILIVVAMVLDVLPVANSQQPAYPVLHHRSARERDSDAIDIRENAAKLLPSRASGEYRLGDSGLEIELIDQFGELSGWLRMPDGDSGQQLTYNFDSAGGSSGHLSFLTRQVHGIRYSFEGTIRSAGQGREQGSLYSLEGELLAHDAARRTIQRRTISLKQNAQR